MGVPTAMRILFIIVGFLGLLLVGIGWFEYQAASEESTAISELEQALMPSYRVINGHKVGMMYNVLWGPDNTQELEKSSSMIVSIGVVLFVIGVTGFIKSGKKTPTCASPDAKLI